MNGRPIPPAAVNDENSVEMLRVWIAQQKLHCSLKIGMYREMGIEEEVAWGTILADAARHISNALTIGNGEDQQAVLAKICANFNSELASPTSTAAGELISPDKS